MGGGPEYILPSDSCAPAPLCSPGGSLLPSTPGPSLTERPEPQGWLLTGGGENLRDQWTIAITSPPSSRQDPGILAQQSDVRCKRGRLCVILIAPAAHTSKGLAKAFVSSAGGKGPENRDTPAPLSPRLRGARLLVFRAVSPGPKDKNRGPTGP